MTFDDFDQYRSDLTREDLKVGDVLRMVPEIQNSDDVWTESVKAADTYVVKNIEPGCFVELRIETQNDGGTAYVGRVLPVDDHSLTLFERAVEPVEIKPMDEIDFETAFGGDC